MQPTKINQEVGYLVLHEQILDIGDENHMVFQEVGDVPLCITPQDRLVTDFIQCDDT